MDIKDTISEEKSFSDLEECDIFVLENSRTKKNITNF